MPPTWLMQYIIFGSLLELKLDNKYNIRPNIMHLNQIKASKEEPLRLVIVWEIPFSYCLFFPRTWFLLINNHTSNGNGCEFIQHGMEIPCETGNRESLKDDR